MAFRKGFHRRSRACNRKNKTGGKCVNQKVGLDYFPVECVTDEGIKLVTAEFGLQAFAIIIKLFQKIYGGYGYYCAWDREVGLLFAQENGMVHSKVEGAGYSQVSLLNEIVLCCTRRGVFSRLQYERNGILTSKKIQENYILATKRRKNVVLRKAYLLVKVAHLPENVSILDENVYILDGNVNTLGQSKVEENNILSLCKIPPPDLEEVKHYVAENGIKTDAGRFYAFYKMKGWKDSAGNPVEDWKAALDYWVTFERGQKKNARDGNDSAQKGRGNPYGRFEERDVTGDDLDSLERALLKRG